MDREEIIKDFKCFFNTNREKLRDVTVAIKDLPVDDIWIQDDEWDEIYTKAVLRENIRKF